MYVRPRRSRQHVWQSKNWLPVQSVVGGAQPAGNVLGETTENLPSDSSTFHPSAAQPGTDTHTDPATQIDGSADAGGEEDVRKGRLDKTSWNEETDDVREFLNNSECLFKV